METTSTRAYIAVGIVMQIMCACSNETPQKAEIFKPSVAARQEAGKFSGETLFKQFCSNCHPDGGNASDPERTLHGGALRKHHINKPEDIINIMRNPLSRMIRFDKTTLPDRDARAIAEYILEAYQ